MFEAGKSIEDIKLSWQTDVDKFNQIRTRYFLY